MKYTTKIQQKIEFDCTSLFLTGQFKSDSSNYEIKDNQFIQNMFCKPNIRSFIDTTNENTKVLLISCLLSNNQIIDKDSSKIYSNFRGYFIDLSIKNSFDSSAGFKYELIKITGSLNDLISEYFEPELHENENGNQLTISLIGNGARYNSSINKRGVGGGSMDPEPFV